MLLPGENSPKSWLFITILVSTIIAVSIASEGKTLDIKFGFELTHGSIGAPSLRIRDFKDTHEFNPRALDGESSNDESNNSDKKKPSSEELAHGKKEDSSKERIKPEKSEDDDDGGNDDKSSDSTDDTVRVTRGPKAGDFEPEDENPKIHEKYDKISESENNSDGDRRYKRQIGGFGNRR